MKVERGALIRAMNIAAMVIETRNTISILSHMAIVPMGESVTFTGTDLDMEVSAEIRSLSVGGEPFTIAAPSRVARVLNLGADEVEMEQGTVDKSKTIIGVRSGRLDLRVLTLPYEDFPRIVASTLATSIELSLEHIDAMLRAARAASGEEIRYYLNGLYLHACDEPSTVSSMSLKAVSSDGHRLYVAPIAAAGIEALAQAMPANSSPLRGVSEGRGVIIPRKAINLLRRLRPKIDGAVTFGVAPRMLENSDKTLAPATAGTIASFAFTMNKGETSVRISTKVIDGTFPAYERVIPAGEQDKRVQVKRGELAQAVRLIGATTTGRTKAVRLHFDPAQERLAVEAVDVEDILSAAVWIPARTNVKEPFTVCFNGRYLADICEVSAGEDLMLETMDSGAPARITSLEDAAFRTVLMPMRL